MQQSIEHLPVFNGRTISTTLQNGEWYVAIKPICEALGVQYNAQHSRILDHHILGQLSCKRMIVAADGRLREMVCLPERYIYGWLFSINSDSPKFLEFQRACYDILYNHFHGALTGRAGVIAERSAIDIEIEKAELELTESDTYRRLQDLKTQKAKLGKKLSAQVKEFDKSLLAVQGTLFPSLTDNN